MKRGFILGMLCSLLCTLGPEYGFSEETVHVMQKGETIYSIARSYGVSPQDVLSLNGIADARTIQAGQRIRIPGQPAAGAVPPQGRGQGVSGRDGAYEEYRIEKNDTLYSIARQYGINLAELQAMNGFAPGHVIKAGEKIRVPVRAGSAVAVSSAPAGGTGRAGNTETRPAVSSPAAPVKPEPQPVPQAKPDASIRWPVKAKEVSYLSGKLYGVQVTGERQEAVKSLTGGTVVSTGPFRGFGRVAIVQANGYIYVYGGCESLLVKEGDKIVPGTELGKLGIDVKTSKPQLFFLVYRGNTPVDPAKAPRA